MSSRTNSENPLYAIVEFKGEDFQKRSVDLVLYQWLIERDDTWLCRYPPEKSYIHLDEWLVELKHPEMSWELFPVEILSFAKSLKQGKRRLERSYISKDIETTSVSTNSTLSRYSSESQNDLELLESETTITMSPDDELPNLSNKDLKDLVSHFNTKISEMEERLICAIRGARRSTKYDLDRTAEEIKNSILALNLKDPKTGLELCQTLRANLPFKTLEEFLEFETKLEEETNQKDTFVAFLKMLIMGGTQITQSIQKLMTCIFTKTIELNYSGSGRQIRGVGKRNFSKTNTFKCKKDVLKTKYGKSDEEIKSLLGRWLSGATDREGGRKARVSNQKNEDTSSYPSFSISLNT